VLGNLPRPDAIRVAAKLGYKAVEFWENDGFDVAAYKQALDETGVTLACMGGGGNLVDANARTDFANSVKAAIENAKILGAKGLIATTGQELENVPREAQKQSIIDGLKEAAKLLAGTGLKMYLEPLNILVDHMGYFLYTSAEGFEIIRAVDSPDVKLLYDIYHQQITEGQLIANISNNIDLIGHFHVAGNPGRGEPYFGEINYVEVFKAIKAAGYTGYAGLEYWAKVDSPEDSLKKVKELA